MTDKLKCSLCDEEATVHLTQIVNNKIHKVDLCEKCAQQKGVTNSEGFSMAELLSKTSETLEKQDPKLVCPHCGYKTSDFRRTGRLGCASCYDTFIPILKPVLQDMQVGIAHMGKVPKIALHRQIQLAASSGIKEVSRSCD